MHLFIFCQVLGICTSKMQWPFKNWTVRFSNGHFSDTICFWFLNGWPSCFCYSKTVWKIEFPAKLDSFIHDRLKKIIFQNI
jgi:hypothetical protein